MKIIKQFLLTSLYLTTLSTMLYGCGSEEDSFNDDKTDNIEDIAPTVTPPVNSLMAKPTKIANQLEISWTNPTGIITAELAY